TLRVSYYTDPLCCWSWAFEPHWWRLRFEFGRQLIWEYRMGGLISSWNSFSDPLNSVSNPSQMAPYWIQVREMARIPLNERVWLVDPPHSSYPACLAFKAAEMQSRQAGEFLLWHLRRQFMVEGQNIGDWGVLRDIAGRVSDSGLLDYPRFMKDLRGNEALELLRQDFQDASFREINRFPSLVVRSGGRAILLVGFRPYEILIEAISAIAPDVKRLRQTSAEDAAQALESGDRSLSRLYALRD